MKRLALVLVVIVAAVACAYPRTGPAPICQEDEPKFKAAREAWLNRD